MSLRNILAGEGLIKQASIQLDKRTIARLNGGSLAIRRGVAAILDTVPGKYILDEETIWGRVRLKPGYAKRVSISDAKKVRDTLLEQGWSKGASNMRSKEGVLLWPPDLRASNYGGVIITTQKTGDAVVMNDSYLKGVGLLAQELQRFK